ncbi:hypothetical protein PoB_007353900 [Plakobranchus ocellatus]|uniref:Uncharacterized protein n=1 Tax=Plakobranchus ocellatus TaxID=259542 RepID=A0AAV4DS16_9GAST|nr:hypothetical protein PoB_007353900 [Plakobranchus ocellatus]
MLLLKKSLQTRSWLKLVTSHTCDSPDLFTRKDFAIHAFIIQKLTSSTKINSTIHTLEVHQTIRNPEPTPHQDCVSQELTAYEFMNREIGIQEHSNREETAQEFMSQVMETQEGTSQELATKELLAKTGYTKKTHAPRICQPKTDFTRDNG